ncbi:HEAT repeat domain-containing protein [Microseira wollei]|uniref:HEAT repeat-containing PBS lyase n=1 Tax=Microseira wollei NIES-4236 TaxID=2530354 RepID=A0AAV3XMU1_9CYAN|nr:HEAT repeat domain-containing protein [Microseira wollei]GET43819.1 HEAT repeat-containing PBS lyase [Microseira wollei NIES-4236]
MVKHSRNKFVALLTVAFLSRSSPLALTSSSWAQKPTDAQIADLIQKLNSNDELERNKTIEELGKIGQPAVSKLVAALKDGDLLVRLGAAQALESIDLPAVPALTAALKDKNVRVRRRAASALSQMNLFAYSSSRPPELKAAIPILITALKDKDKNVRRNATFALQSIGAEAKAAVNDLTVALKDPDKDVRNNAAWALGSIAFGVQRKARANALSSSDLDRVISDLDKALKILEDPQNNFSQNRIARVSLPLDVLKAKRSDRIFIESILKNPWVWGSGIYLVSLFGIFWLRPLWLLKIDNILKPIGFKLPVLGAEISPRYLIFLKYHPRVLDAWVAFHLKSVREEFQEKNTVRDRKVYIPVPVILDGNNIAQLTGKDLRSSCKKQRGCLLIWGEGGAGKTSLACQIAKWAIADNPDERLCEHRMLPILIEQELDFETATGQQPFMAAIRGQLQDLTNETEAISEELLERLLRQRRILVIVDHFSEMGEATRKAIRPESPDFCVNALVLTSRTEETLGQVTRNSLQPLRIEGNRLSSFMEAYLTQRGKRNLFTDAEFFDACSLLSQMVGQRNITVLLAKLYAEQLIVAKEDTSPDQLPDNIPDLMLSYLNELNRNVTGDKLSDRTVHQEAKTLAWECLKRTFRPTSAKREDASATLSPGITAQNGDSAELHLKYLETRLRLIQTIGPAQDQIRFYLDPLAEYLAGLYLLDVYGKDAQLWQQFLQEAAAMPGAPESIKGFLLAVRDCCLAKGKEAKVPDFVAEELGKLAGISPIIQPPVAQMQTGIVS